MNVIGWPFSITVDGDVSARANGKLTIDFKATPPVDIFGQVQYAVESFVALADAGGLGGDRLNPLESIAILSTNAPATHGTSFVWELTTIAIDPRSLVILFNMLTFLGKDIRAVIVEIPGSGPSIPFSTADFPPMWPIVPFDIDDDRSDPNVEVEIEFAQDVPPALHEMLIDAVETWLSCGLVQGFRDWTEPDDSSYLIPLADPPFSLIDNSLVGHFQDLGLVEECYDIFFNILIKIHATARIRSVDLL